MADEVLRGLTASESTILRTVVNTVRQGGNKVRPHRPDEGVAHQEWPSSGIYVARTPGGGIPGLNTRIEHHVPVGTWNPFAGTGTGTSSYRVTPGTGSGTFDYPDEPGFAECTIWKLIEREEEDLTGLYIYEEFTKIVYNRDTCPISGNKWILIGKDASGTWWALEKGVCTGNEEEWVECTERVVNVLCIGNLVVTYKVYDYWSVDGRRLFTSNTPCPDLEAANCCEAIGGSPLPNLTSTVTHKTGCYITLPGTINWVSEADPVNTGKFRWHASTTFTACGVANDDPNAWFIDICTSLSPHAGAPQLGTPVVGGLALGNYNCSPFSATFLFDDNVGNALTLVVTEA